MSKSSKPEKGLSQFRLSIIPGLDADAIRGLNIALSATSAEGLWPSTQKFWFSHGAPAAIQQPASRHCIIALGACFEQRMCMKEGIPYNSAIVYRHYSYAVNAIQDIINQTSLSQHDLDCILTACICIAALDFVRGNFLSTLQHIIHGITIINAYCPYSELASHFRFMSLAALASPARRIIPLLTNMGCPYAICNGRCFPGRCAFEHSPFTTVNRAQDSLQFVEYYIFRLARFVDGHRAASPDSPDWPQYILQEQSNGYAYLRNWHALFANIKANPGPDPDKKSAILILEIRSLVAKIVLGTILDDRPAQYDLHIPDFERVIKLGEQSIALGRVAKFMVDSKLSPHIEIIQKCRYLPLRLKGLSMMHNEHDSSHFLLSAEMAPLRVRALIEADYGHTVQELETMENPPLFPIGEEMEPGQEPLFPVIEGLETEAPPMSPFQPED
ncbi:hypothetical protein N7456_010107 [Penicillium angulare]|uniref:Uncharacterized protein n=1 Tax=Penicillium angulare TaxID=116970 RepID=A0A9W9K6D3_9EURO|nr:hypothetical protein N7456_010107 [Penicillium angulare]